MLGFSSRALGALWLSLLLGAGGCVIPKQVGDDLETGDGGGSGSDGPAQTGDGSTTDTPSDTEPSPTTGSPGACEDNPLYQCSTTPYDCGAFPCGGLFSWFDDDGCMRQPCGGPEDCGADEVCFTPLDVGGCVSSGIDCFDGEDGSCTCGADPDCGGSYCMPQGEVPSTECLGLPDEASCLDAGCNYFETVTEITDTCACVLDVPACVFFIDEIGGADAPDYFWHEQTLTVAFFSTSFFDPPAGWRPCTDPGAPAACGCYEPFMDPACP